MADNLTTTTTVSTVPSGTVIATDDVSGVHYQKVKLVIGAADEANLVDNGQQVMTGSMPVVLASDHSDVKITLDGEAVTISGTVQVQSNSANLATQTAAAAIQAAVEIIDNAISGSEMQVDIVSGGPIGATTDAEATGDGSVIAILKRLRTLLGGTLTVGLPAGAATSAKQDTVIGHLDGVEGLLTTIDADTGALAGAIAGSEMQVDIVGALPAGSNAIGKLAANSGIDIGDVDVTSVTPGTAASSLGKAEDAAHTTGDVGVMALGVRQDADAAFGADGDYAPMQFDGNGNLKVNIKAGAGSGGTASTDDGAFTAAAGSGTPMMGFVTADSVDSGDVGVVGMLANRQLKVTLYDSSGVELAVGGGTQYTEDAAAAANPVGNALILVREDARAGSLTTTDGDNVAARGNNKGEQYVKATDSDALLTTIDADTGTIAGAVAGSEMQVDVVGSLPAGTNNIGDVDVLTLPALPAGNNNIGDVDIASIAAGDNNIGNVDVVTMPAVTNAGTFAVQESGAALTALQLIDDAIFAEDVAAQAADKGIQVLAVRRDADTSLVGADNDYAPLQVNANGALKVEIFDGGDSHTVDGSVTANAGTDLNTSALALESGGNLAGAATSLAVLDDWDESDRAKVNIVAGQAGVTAGAGAVAANTPRVTLASDDPAVVALQTLDNAISGSEMQVDVVGALPAGTNNIGDVDIASIAAGDNNIGNVDVVTMPGVVGTVADDGTTPGSPVMVGGKAVETDGTDPTSVSAEDDVAILRTDRNRRLLVNTAHPNQWVARENHTSAQTNNELKAAPGANLSLYITDIIMSTDVATNIKLVRDTAGTPADIAGPFYFAANGGIAMPLVTPIRVTANQNVGFTGGATGNFTVEIHGYTAP